MHNDNDVSAVRALLTANAVRERAHRMLALAREDRLTAFRLDESRLDTVTDYVLDVTRANYPALDIPLHARWRHFSVGGVDRWGALAESGVFADRDALARAAFDLAIVSVLLDAGAGATWRYQEGRTGQVFSRSEGLAVASFDMFVGGLFAAYPAEPYEADADALAALEPSELMAGFQIGPGNAMTGLSGRLDLLRRLGDRAVAAPALFGRESEPRPGGLYDTLRARHGDSVPAPAILSLLLEALGPIWPGRITLMGVDLGDCWRHPALVMPDETTGLVPFHKLSQWLAYSLIEPLQWAGVTVTDVAGLTGLPEYRNGGLFLDGGVLVLKDPDDALRPHLVDSLLVVEWRALTVALLDGVGERLRARLKLSAADFPLAKALEGGTWAAGRRLARDKRADGGPPLTVVSDGTVF